MTIGRTARSWRLRETVLANCGNDEQLTDCTYWRVLGTFTGLMHQYATAGRLLLYKPRPRMGAVRRIEDSGTLASTVSIGTR